MLFVLFAVALSAKKDANKINLLKQKVVNSAQQFAYDGFKTAPVGIMSIKVDVGHPQSITLTKEMQRPKWEDVTFASPLKAQGYTKMMSVNGGMVFKNAKSEMVECAIAKSSPLDTGKIVLDYKCKPMNKARFAQVKATYWVSGLQIDNQAPSGWDTRWGPFDYPFYTTTSQGILGCKNTSGGYCTPQHADLFPFESCYSNINDAGEVEAECEKRKREKEHELNVLEKEVEEQEKAEDQNTAEFFGADYYDGHDTVTLQGMKISDQMVKAQQQQEKKEK